LIGRVVIGADDLEPAPGIPIRHRFERTPEPR
jgi:hypothetical protein